MVAVTLVLAVGALALAVVALLEVRGVARLAEEVLAAARPASSEDVEWQLQWIEPGVYFLANTSPGTAAYQVEVTSSLTPVAGGPATSATVREQRVNPGSWLEVRHARVAQEVSDDLQQLRRTAALSEEMRRRPAPLCSVDAAALAAADRSVYVLQDRVQYTLAYSVSWRSSSGVVRRKVPLEQRIVPSPAAI